MTNYERIRAMSIDEMATMLLCPAEWDEHFNISCDRTDDCNCYECCKRYLESEAGSNG